MRNPTHFGAVYIALQKKNNDIFMIKRQNTGYYDDFWSLPAGHIEKNEMPRAAAIREAKEEAGVLISEDSLIFKAISHRIRKKDRTYSDYLFTTTTWDNTPYNAEPQKADDEKWFSLAKLPENTVPNQKAILQALVNNTSFIEIWEK